MTYDTPPLTCADKAMAAFDALSAYDKTLWLLCELDVATQAYFGLKKRNLLSDSKCTPIGVLASLLDDRLEETTLPTLRLISRTISLILLHDVEASVLSDIGIPASAVARAAILTHKLTMTQEDNDYLRRSGTALKARFLFHGLQQWVEKEDPSYADVERLAAASYANCLRYNAPLSLAVCLASYAVFAENNTEANLDIRQYYVSNTRFTIEHVSLAKDGLKAVGQLDESGEYIVNKALMLCSCLISAVPVKRRSTLTPERRKVTHEKIIRAWTKVDYYRDIQT